jgi:multiple sugar transport system substrate-binding protein
MSDRSSEKRLSRRQFLAKGAALASAAALAPALAACQTPATPIATQAAAQKPTEPPKAIKLVMANWGTIPDGWKQLGAKFTEQNPNITIEFEGVQANTWSEYFDKLVTQFAAGTPPDTCRIAIEGTQLFASRGLAIPLDTYINADKAALEEYFKDVHVNLVNAMKFKGQQYQLPFTWNGPVIHYNTKIFQDAGIERPKDDWTIEQFLDIAKKLTKGDVYGFGLANGYWGGAIPWLFVAGTDLLNKDWTQSTANDPKTIEAIQFLQDLVVKHKVSPSPAGFNHTQAFTSGKLAMIGTGGGNMRLTFINAGMKDFDILYFPKWREQTHEFGGTGFPVLKSSKNPDAAWKLTRFLVTKESIAFFVNSVAQTPARRSVAYDQWVKAGDPPKNYKIYYDMLDKPSRAVPAPPEYNEIESIFLRYFSLVTANEKTPEAAMNDAHKEIAQVLAARK